MEAVNPFGGGREPAKCPALAGAYERDRWVDAPWVPRAAVDADLDAREIGGWVTGQATNDQRLSGLDVLRSIGGCGRIIVVDGQIEQRRLAERAKARCCRRALIEHRAGNVG